MQTPDIADLDAFAAVARARSFRGAASARGVSPSALSEAVRRLEARLGIRLLNRTTRSVSPTEAGQRLLDRLTPALGEIAGAVDALNSVRDSPAGQVRLNVPTVAARLFLPALVTAFLRQHPGISLDIVATDDFVDMVAGGFDAGIRYDERIERDMIAIPIGPRRQRFLAAAAPSYLARRGTPQHPRDLLAHDCLRHRFTSGHCPPWDFEKEGETVRVAPEGPLIASTAVLQVAAAIAGLGILCTFEGFVRPGLDSGELVTVLDGWLPDFPGPFLYYPSRRHMPGPLRAFIDFVRAYGEGV